MAIRRFGPAIALFPFVMGRDFYIWRTRAFTARLALDVIESLNTALAGAKHNGQGERGGILLGRVLSLDCIEITGFEFFQSEHRRGIAYDLGLKERNRLTSYVQRLRRRKGGVPIGYFRTHLRPGLFLDQDDFAVMTEAFRDGTCAALAIRPEPSGPAEAGFFFWEGDDMNRARTPLAFPFDGSALREQGPVVTVAGPAPKPARPSIPAWQALTLAAAAALFGFAAMSAATRHTRPQSSPVIATPPQAVSAPARSGRVSVDVTVEPKKNASPIKVAAQVPRFIPARPGRPLSPRVPQAIASKLSKEVPVDVRVSIDKQGVVRDTEVLSGGGSPFSSLAADDAFWTPWQPARLGDRTVASEMIVHYRFSPATEGPR